MSLFNMHIHTHVYLVLIYDTKNTAHTETGWKKQTRTQVLQLARNSEGKINICHHRGLALLNTRFLSEMSCTEVSVLQYC